jgi:predicted nucleic acid-binding protein
MVVVDSSALIPLARVGRLDLIPAVFETIATTEAVAGEVVVEGKPGAAALEEFLDGAATHESPASAEETAALEGIAVADASVVLLADERGERLLANDRGLITVARSHDVESWWVTTLLLRCAKAGVPDGGEAKDVLYDLVDSGMNLDPQVYTQVQRKLDEIGK